ncbi:MAG: right-handed parallel beta-helix repeat-containing protein [Planctomycetes bacterium]|nr:right-handed parallel beta-helix repeat-containing protein [Planctomycetota bacterium]
MEGVSDSAVANVRAHGARGDGASDDTEAIRRAIAAVPDAGGVVFFPPGHYLTDTIQARSFTTYMGHSAWAYSHPLPGGVVISPIRPDMPCLINAGKTSGTRFVGLALRGNPRARSRDDEHFTGWMRDTGHRMDGIYFGRGGDQAVIDDCRIDLFSGSGVRVVDCGVWAVRHSLVLFNRLFGIDAERTADAWIIDTGLTSNGVGVRCTASITITGNRIEHNEQAGVVLNPRYAGGIQITGNLFCCNSGPAIVHDGNIAEAVSITGNTIRHLPMERSAAMAADADRDCHIRLINMEGLCFTGNSIYNIRESEGVARGMILGRLRDSVVCNNTLFHAATAELIHDEGGHTNTIIKDNPGSLLDRTI